MSTLPFYDSVGDLLMVLTEEMASCKGLKSGYVVDVQVARQAVESEANVSACCELFTFFHFASFYRMHLLMHPLNLLKLFCWCSEQSL